MVNSTNNILLAKDNKRYVMFPIRDNDIWNMYIKAEDSFWRVQEAAHRFRWC